MKYILKKEEISDELNDLDPLLHTLLVNRGIKERHLADHFLSPNYDRDVYDPYLMKDMEKAVLRILKAIDQKEKIVIYSDYDADGIPGAVILHDFFKRIGYENMEVYIPNRHDEGYGVHTEAIEEFAARKVTLLITIDCGTTDVSPIALAQSLGIDVVVTDHHLSLHALPPAYAILNPKQEGCNYPEDMLCGAGIVFKLVQALFLKRDFGLTKGTEKWFLDMVSIATLSDIVPLTGENRALAHYGLTVLRKARRMGIQAMCQTINIFPAHLTEDDITFMITPRLNAASRMGNPKEAFLLLTATDKDQASELSSHLNTINNERKGIVAALIKDIRRSLAQKEPEKIIVIGNPNWKPALLGLAASRIVEEYKRPVFIWGRAEGEFIKGSCRSDGLVDVSDLMTRAKEGFVKFGGHRLAGGFSVSHEEIHTLPKRLNDAYVLSLEGKTPEILPSIEIDTVLSLDEVNQKTFNLINSLSPFGMGNPKPLFLFEDVLLADVILFGKGKEHLRFTLESSKGKKISAIGFFMTSEDLSVLPQKGAKINLVGTIEESRFAGKHEIRLRIVDTV
ncbi:MAG: single-stranded-DNA-specific exonuclease RecJ [Patescibacteria group bacterium]